MSERPWMSKENGKCEFSRLHECELDRVLGNAIRNTRLSNLLILRWKILTEHLHGSQGLLVFSISQLHWFTLNWWTTALHPVTATSVSIFTGERWRPEWPDNTTSCIRKENILLIGLQWVFSFLDLNLETDVSVSTSFRYGSLQPQVTGDNEPATGGKLHTASPSSHTAGANH